MDLNRKLIDEQRKTAEGLDFGSLLNLQCNMLNQDFIWKLAERFNPKTRKLKFGRLRAYEISIVEVARAPVSMLEAYQFSPIVTTSMWSTLSHSFYKMAKNWRED